MLSCLLISIALALPVEEARRALTTPVPDGLVMAPKVLPWAGGTIVRFAQTLDGLPVLGAGPRVVLDRGDQILRQHGRILRTRPDTLSPTLGPGAAILAAQDALRIDPAEGRWPERTHLAVFEEAGCHLVWAVDLSRIHPFQTWRVLVDAVDGTIRHAEPTTHTVDGTVFPESPLHSDPVVVELQHLWSTERLAGTYAEVFSCVEWDIDPEPFGRRDCLAIEPTATPDHKGNYRYDPTYGDLTDPFAEVHAYYHTDLISSWANDRWEIRGSEPIRVLTNFPLTNAFYGDFDGDGVRDISFGISDDLYNFAYDSDVVYHEYGHAIVRMVAGSMGMGADEIGIDWTSGSLNEGTADVFAMALNGDPLLAEYLGQSERWDRAIRDLEPDRRCPDDLQSEVHRSGEIVGALGWNLIELMGEDLTAELLVGALGTWSNQTTWSDAGQSFLDAAQDLHAAGELGDTTLAEAETLIRASGMPDCTRIVDLGDVPTSTQYLLNLGLDGDLARFPTGVQFKLQAPPEATAIELEILEFDGKSNGTGWTLTIRAGAPVGHEATRVEGVGLAYAVPVDFDLQVDGERTGRIRLDESSALRLEPGEVYYFAIAARNLSREPLDIDYAKITVAGRATLGTLAPETALNSGGCSTRGPGGTPPLGAWFLMLTLLGLGQRQVGVRSTSRQIRRKSTDTLRFRRG